ncbi:MAG: NAD(P)H-dependent oxidoreductase [Bacteroidota bacterium]
MAKILAFAGSNSSTSINLQLVKHTAAQIKNHEVRVLDMTRYPFPMYSADIEKQIGFSNSLVEFKNEFAQVDGVVLSVNEHNGNISAYFKNIVDWLSRLERTFLADKPILLMSASPGKGGAKNALSRAEQMLPYFGGKVVATFSLPSFGQNLTSDGIVDAEMASKHHAALEAFLKEVS